MLRPISDPDSATPQQAIVEQAKGALMLRYGIGSRESLAVLERWALEAGMPAHDIADALVNGICLGRVTAETEVSVRWLQQRLRGDISDVRGGGPGGAAEGPAPGGSTAVTSVPAPAPAVAERRQWRYSSAVHAARVLRSR
ncbi:ANTAR domain-containing protein [Nocardioides sp. S5]|uniref:ANTAR domain-containing protein n=1 Tax=Nocardioides sp. S5 TaxID=2017486 RepID=UPI001A8E21E2|nr:ANTAR domain-containing protein [Nocardioides sp. S5]